MVDGPVVEAVAGATTPVIVVEMDVTAAKGAVLPLLMVSLVAGVARHPHQEEDQRLPEVGGRNGEEQVRVSNAEATLIKFGTVRRRRPRRPLSCCESCSLRLKAPRCAASRKRLSGQSVVRVKTQVLSRLRSMPENRSSSSRQRGGRVAGNQWSNQRACSSRSLASD